MQKKILMIIPVFNECHRWNSAYFEAIGYTSSELADFLFVDDGSDDDSLDLIKNQCSLNSNWSFLALPKNVGKSEAVRIGIQRGIELKYFGIGFMDSDGAFSARDVLNCLVRFLDKCSEISDYDAVWSSRLSIAGRNIQRSKSRHVIGRIISVVICSFLRKAPWDTQSGLKIFKSNRKLSGAITNPFHTRWFFEIEILQRTHIDSSNVLKIWEEPLEEWMEVHGSKISLKSFSSIAREILFVIGQNICLYSQLIRRSKHESRSQL